MWDQLITIDLTNLTNPGSICAVRRDRRGATNVAAARLTLRVDFGKDRAIGPGKIRLLEAIRDTGSITQAGVALGMSYRRAWLLVDDVNNCFREPVVAAQKGGTHGGGAALTLFGRKLIDQYRAIEAEAHSATAARLHELEAACKETRKPRGCSKTLCFSASPHHCSLTARKNAADAPGKKFCGQEGAQGNRD